MNVEVIFVTFLDIPGQTRYVGTDRKSTESIGSVVEKQRKQPVPAVGTVDLGFYKNKNT